MGWENPWCGGGVAVIANPRQATSSSRAALRERGAAGGGGARWQGSAARRGSPGGRAQWRRQHGVVVWGGKGSLEAHKPRNLA